MFLSLGSNLGDRAKKIAEACKRLSSLGQVTNTSFMYHSEPMYVANQPQFLNCCIEVMTVLPPDALLLKCKEIERSLGRVTARVIDKGPRCIDIDILFYDSIVWKTASLTIPHPLLQERLFVLEPLHDIPSAASFVHPVLHRSVTDLFRTLLSSSSGTSLQRVLPMTSILECADLASTVTGQTVSCTSFSDTFLPVSSAYKKSPKTHLMGILNTTPDSFSDGGEFNNIEEAVKRAQEMTAAGCDIIDIGGQSTRPNADLVDEEEEKSRVVPVIKAIRERGISTLISVDTFRSSVAESSLLAGANMVNDVTAGMFDENMFSVIQKFHCPIVLMHMRGTPKTMNQLTTYQNLLSEVRILLLERAQKALNAGIYRWQIILDPGIGFAKNQQQNIEILQKLSNLQCLSHSKYPLLVGPSRKRFIGNITKVDTPKDRQMGTAVCVTTCISSLIDMVRVHDCKEMKQVLLMADALYR